MSNNSVILPLDAENDGIFSSSFTDYEEMKSSGYCSLFKAKRYGKWFVIKGLKEKYKGVSFYESLLRKEFELTVGLDHPNIVKVIGFEHDGRVGDCIVMDFVDGMTLDNFLLKNIKKQFMIRLSMSCLTRWRIFMVCRLYIAI